MCMNSLQQAFADAKNLILELVVRPSRRFSVSCWKWRRSDTFSLTDQQVKKLMELFGGMTIHFCLKPSGTKPLYLHRQFMHSKARLMESSLERVECLYRCLGFLTIVKML